MPVPTVFDYRGTVRTLDQTLLGSWWVYQPLVFCIGVVLLFSKGGDGAAANWTGRVAGA